MSSLTHGRHCPCSACQRQDWTDPTIAHCGMHGPECPVAAYDGPERRLHEPRRSTDKWPGFTSNTGSPFPGDRRRR